MQRTEINEFYARVRVTRDLLELRNLVQGRTHRALGPTAPRKPGPALWPGLSEAGGAAGGYYFGAARGLSLGELWGWAGASGRPVY